MLPRELRNYIVERELRDNAGRLARVTFLVYEEAGRMRARVIDVAYLEEANAGERPLAICGSSCDNAAVLPAESVPGFGIESPYFDTELIYSIGSKPRAPAFG